LVKKIDFLQYNIIKVINSIYNWSLLLKNQQFSECCLKTSRLKVKQLTDERSQEELILVAGKKLRKLEK